MATSPRTEAGSSQEPARWLLPQTCEQQARQLALALGIQAPAARVLVRRGYDDPAAARRFLKPSLDHLGDPFLLAGMREAAARLAEAVKRREPVLLYGDYDVDGVCAVVVLSKAIEMAGGKSQFRVPHRLREGYGMHPEALEEAARCGVRLVISVDTGIRAQEAVRHAARLGVDVIITDHHLPEANLPPALAVLNPNRADCPYPDKNLCGAAVALKLAQALLALLGWPQERQRRLTESFLKIVALATVADIVPLQGENRIIVKHGLSGMRKLRNAGLRALMHVAGFREGDTPSASQIAFRLAPRLNAAGRMADAEDVIRLFLTDSEQEAHAIAERLHSLNQERQQTEAEIVAAILDECQSAPVTAGQAALVFAGRGWHRGVLGIVASRLVERFHRPALVLSEEDGLLQGSGRSIRSFHLLEALEAHRDLLLRFGGHRTAAGLTLEAARLEQLRERLNRYAAERLLPADFQPLIEIDALLEFSEIRDAAVMEVLALAPFGAGNPEPRFLVRGAQVVGEPTVFRERHVRVALRAQGRTLFFKGWNLAGRIEQLRPGSLLDAVISFEEDPYAASRGHPAWAAQLVDVRPSEAQFSAI